MISLTILVGYLGNDAEIKFNAKGNAKLSLRLATTESRPDGDKWVEHTEWHDVVVWGKRGEALAPLCFKGRFVAIIGSNATSTWDDKTTGQRRKKTEVVVGFGDKVALGPDTRNRDEEGGG